jgi:hypothetical protein
MTVDDPAHSTPLAAVTVGELITVKVVDAEDVQPPLEPVTVYTVVTAGLRSCEAPVIPPGFHVYALAPLAVSNVEVPLQILPVPKDIVGVLETVIEIVEVELHPLVVPVIV